MNDMRFCRDATGEAALGGVVRLRLKKEAGLRKAATLGLASLMLVGIVFAILPLFARPASAQAVTWARTYGGTGDDYAYSIRPTSDGGYVVAGETDTFGAGGNNYGNDFWILKLDSYGAVQWEKTYGTAMDDLAQMIQQTSDGGYIVAGVTAWWDAWIMKLDSGGNVEWQKTYGTEKPDMVQAIVQTSDGGYAFVGFTNYYQKGRYGDIADLWIVRLDSAGNIVWQKIYNLGEEWGISIEQTSDGGFIVGGGTSYSVGTKKSTVSYNSVIFLMKLNPSGVVTWQKNYGGWTTPSFQWEDYGPEVHQTPDGGYIVAGTVYGQSYDYLVFKVDSTGGIVWQEYLDNGSTTDFGKSVSLTSDGGYIVAGTMHLYPNYDLWVVKLAGNGAVQWQKTYGGTGSEGVKDISTVQQALDGGYVVAATTTSYGAGGVDIWVLKLDTDGSIGGCTVPGCGVDTHATPVAGTIIPVAIPTMVLRSLPTSVVNTAATVMNSAATVNIQCTG